MNIFMPISYNLTKMDKFLERHKPAKLSEEIDNLNSSVSVNTDKGYHTY